MDSLVLVQILINLFDKCSGIVNTIVDKIVSLFLIFGLELTQGQVRILTAIISLGIIFLVNKFVTQKVIKVIIIIFAIIFMLGLLGAW